MPYRGAASGQTPPSKQLTRSRASLVQIQDGQVNSRYKPRVFSQLLDLLVDGVLVAAQYLREGDSTPPPLLTPPAHSLVSVLQTPGQVTSLKGS